MIVSQLWRKLQLRLIFISNIIYDVVDVIFASLKFFILNRIVSQIYKNLQKQLFNFSKTQKILSSDFYR